MKKINLKTKIDEVLWEKLDHFSKKTKRPKTWILREAIKQYLADNLDDNDLIILLTKALIKQDKLENDI